MKSVCLSSGETHEEPACRSLPFLSSVFQSLCLLKITASDESKQMIEFRHVILHSEKSPWKASFDLLLLILLLFSRGVTVSGLPIALCLMACVLQASAGVFLKHILLDQKTK